MASIRTPVITPEVNDTLNLGEIFSFLRRKLTLILAFVLIATVLAAWHVLTAVPQFTANSTLYLGDAQTAMGGDTNSKPGFLSDYSSVNDVETQLELITAKELVQQVVLETGLNAQIDTPDSPANAGAIKYWRWKYRYGRRVDVFKPNASSLQVLYSTTPGSFKVVLGENNTYQLYSKPGLFSHPRLLLSGVIGQPAAGNGVQVLIKPVLASFVGVPGKIYNLQILPPGVLADNLTSGALNVKAGGSVTSPTKVAFLQFSWSNPYQAQIFINQVMQDFIATQVAWKTESALTTENFISDQLKQVSQSLNTADANLATYQAETGIINVPQNAQAVISALSQYQSQRTALQLQQEALQQLSDELNHSNGPLNPYLVSQASDTVLENLTNSLSTAETQLAQLHYQYTGDAREVQMQQLQVDKLQSSISTIINNNLAAANKNLASLNRLIDGYQQQIKAMPAEALKVIELQRASDVLGQLYVSLMEKEQEAEVSKAATIVNTRVVTAADLPVTNSSPKLMITVLFGAFAGLIAAVGLVFGQRALSGRFETEEEIRNAAQLPVYSAIPRRDGAESERYILGKGRQRPFYEAFRLLRGRLYRQFPAHSAIITIISPADDDATTLIAANLAKTLADNGRKTLLVDAELKQQSVSKTFKIDHMPGLIDWLTTKIQPSFVTIPNEKIKILAAGAAELAPEDLLDDPGLTGIFTALRTEFDFIIVNSSPLPEFSDGLALGGLSDLILSVVSLSHTNRRLFTEHRDLLSSLEKKRHHYQPARTAAGQTLQFRFPETPWPENIPGGNVGQSTAPGERKTQVLNSGAAATPRSNFPKRARLAASRMTLA